MIVIVCGGRDFKDRAKLFSALDYWMSALPITKLVHGGQTSLDHTQRNVPWAQRDKWGADYLAGEWAASRKIPVAVEAVSDADWKKQGAAAGPIRNRRMLTKYRPERVISAPGGRGTEDMLRQARESGVRCIEIA